MEEGSGVQNIEVRKIHSLVSESSFVGEEEDVNPRKLHSTFICHKSILTSHRN